VEGSGEEGTSRRRERAGEEREDGEERRTLRERWEEFESGEGV
jgi:hypothetical protein